MTQYVRWVAFALVYVAGINLFVGVLTGQHVLYILAGIVAVPCTYLGAHLAHEMHLSDRIGPVNKGADSAAVPDEDWETAS